MEGLRRVTFLKNLSKKELATNKGNDPSGVIIKLMVRLTYFQNTVKDDFPIK